MSNELNSPDILNYHDVGLYKVGPAYLQVNVMWYILSYCIITYTCTAVLYLILVHFVGVLQ